jgi:hypothetical protein
MAIFTHKCTHENCLTEHIAHRVHLAYPLSDHRAAVLLSCPKCKLPSAAIIKPEAGQISKLVEPSQLANQPGEITHYGWSLETIWPTPTEPNIPELLPPDIVRVYLQAERNFPINGNEEAAGIMYGKALDIGLKKIDPTLSGMLGPRIKALAEAGNLTSDIAEWSNNIRTIRNEATHDEESITRDDLIALRSFTDMVLRYLFSLPNSVKKRRGEKLSWETDASSTGSSP